MFRTLSRAFLPNPLDWKLKRCARKGGKKVLLFWNRGLGDIALGLYAIVHRIRHFLPDAEITFLTRENLLDGFSMLEGVKAVGVPSWKRGEANPSLKQVNLDEKDFDLIIEKPNPTEWVRWQIGKIAPKLTWDVSHDKLYEKFGLPDGPIYIGVQISAETHYGTWRNWPVKRWEELSERLGALKSFKLLLFGFGAEPKIEGDHIIDLRGRTSLFELLSLIKNRCRYLILPDSGILSMAYYLDAQFPLHIISLWADPNHGILKQKAASPNLQLVHTPLIGSRRDLASVSVSALLQHIAPVRPLTKCCLYSEISNLASPLKKTGAIILAGGQGSRLGSLKPKGMFPIHGKSLFEWICEKAPKEHFPIAVMTSLANHEETVAFFDAHGRFGRDIHFFSQSSGALLDEKKKPIGEGPDGNGSVYKSFVDSGLDRLFEEKGVEHLLIVPVENPLADPADSKLVAYHLSNGSDVTLKCVERLRPDESMGVLVERMGRIEIIEYLDLNPQETYRYNHAGMMAMSLSFLKKMASVDLPLHWVRKKVKDEWVWKGEKFIFDALPYANRVSAVCYPRELSYAPLKSLEQLEELNRRLSGVKKP